VQKSLPGEKAMARKKQPKLGRPPKHEGERLSKNRTFRVRGTLDEQLEAAAQKAGRSVSEEIERRLADTFRTEGTYGGPHISAVFRLIVDSIALLKTGGSLAETDQARANIATLFVDLLAKELPGVHSVTIEIVGPDGEIRGHTGYVSEEARERDLPGTAEILKQRRAALASQAEAARGEEPK
jgi:hypothetical protein